MVETSWGARLQRARKLAGFRTQRVLADALGKSERQIRNWETGVTKPENIAVADRDLLYRLVGNFDDEGDRVEAAIRASDLDDWRKQALVSEYGRHRHEQQREQAAG